MAYTDPQNDPTVEQQLYADLGPGLPSLADPVDLGPWVAPDHWFSPPEGDDQLAHLGPGAAPPGAPAGLPATAAAPPPPPPDVAPPFPAESGVPPIAQVPAQPPPFGAAPINPADLAGADIPPPPPGAEMSDVAQPADLGPPGAPSPMPGEAPPGGELAPIPLPYGLSIPRDTATRTAIANEQHYQQSLHDYAGRLEEIPDLAERQRALNDLSKDPRRVEEWADVRSRLAEDYKAHTRRVEELRTQRLQEYQEAESKAFDAWKTSQAATEAKMADAMASVDRIVNTKIDPSGGLSPFQKIAGFVAAIAGGLYQGRTGSPNNPGLDGLNAIINRSIAEQKAQLEMQLHGAQGKLNLLGQEYTRHGDMYRAEQVMRMASYRVADQLLAIEEQNYVPGGTTQVNISGTRSAARAAATKEAIDLQGTLIKQKAEEHTMNREDYLAKATAAEKYSSTQKNLADVQKILGEVKDNEPMSRELIMQEFPTIPLAAVPYKSMNRKQLQEHLKTFNEATDVASKENATVLRSPVDFQPLLQRNNQVARAGDPTIAQKGNEMLSNTQSFVDTMAHIKEELEAGPSLINREKWGAIQAEFNLAKEHFIKGLNANFSSREMKAVEEVVGGDFDSYVQRFAGKGIAESKIDALIKDEIKSGESLAGTEFGVYRPRDEAGRSTLFKNPLDQPKPEATAIEKASARLNTNIWNLDPDSVKFEDREAWRANSMGAAGVNLPYWKTTEGQRVRATGLSPSQLKIYDGIDADLRAGTDQAKINEDLDLLGEQVKKAPTEQQRILAKKMLEDNVTRGMERLPSP